MPSSRHCITSPVGHARDSRHFGSGVRARRVSAVHAHAVPDRQLASPTGRHVHEERFSDDQPIGRRFGEPGTSAQARRDVRTFGVAEEHWTATLNGMSVCAAGISRLGVSFTNQTTGRVANGHIDEAPIPRLA